MLAVPEERAGDAHWNGWMRPMVGVRSFVPESERGLEGLPHRPKLVAIVIGPTDRDSRHLDIQVLWVLRARRVPDDHVVIVVVFLSEGGDLGLHRDVRL